MSHSVSSGTLSHMIVVFGTYMENDDIASIFFFFFFFHFFKILIFWGFRVGKREELVFKFINKCQTEILRCAPSHVCDFLIFVGIFALQKLEICMLFRRVLFLNYLKLSKTSPFYWYHMHALTFWNMLGRLQFVLPFMLLMIT